MSQSSNKLFPVKVRISLFLPFSVLVVVPCCIEKNLSIQFLPAMVTGLLLTATGLCIICLTVYSFMTLGKGTLAPWFPNGKLVLTGLYAPVRNPMILGA